MITITYKIKGTLIGASGLLAVLLFTLICMPSQAFAETENLALACHPGSAHATATASGAVGCAGGGGPEQYVYIASTSSDKSKYPDDVNITPVKVDCGSVAVANYTKGEKLSTGELRCHTSKTPKVTVGDVIPIGGASGGGSGSDCKLNDGTCASCYNDKGCVDCSKGSCSDPATSCSSTRCDIIANYVQPFINLFSGLVGLIITISLIAGGIMYASSAGDPQKASNAKNRISKTVIAFFIYAFMYAFLQFLIPGGIFK